MHVEHAIETSQPATYGTASKKDSGRGEMATLQFENPMSKSQMVKVVFPLESHHSGGIEREQLWATPLPDGTYLVENSPFHAYGISYGDAVCANFESGDLVFTKVARRGGHSTYRLKLPQGKGDGYFLELWPQLARLGCTYERTGDERPIYSIDLPPSISVHEVYDMLTRLEEAGLVEFEEGHYCHPSVHH